MSVKSVMLACSEVYPLMQVPMTVVFGKPIILPQIDDPTEKEIRKYLDLYISAMEGICERHKQIAGYGNTVFKVV